MGDGAFEVGVDEVLGGFAGWVELLHLERSGAHDEEHLVGGTEAQCGLGGVVAVLPGGIVFDGVDGHVAHHAVAAGEGGGETGKGGEGVHELRVGFAPDEALHAAHGGAEDKAEVIDVQALGEHDLLRANHVVVVVVGEVHVQAVGGLGRLAMTDVVGEDEEVLRDVEGFAGAEEDVGEDGVEERVGVAAGAVEEEDGVVGVALRVAVRCAEGEVMEVEPPEGFTGLEVEVGDVEGAVLGWPLDGFGGCGGLLGRGGLGEGSGCKEQEGGEAAEAHGARSQVFGPF